MKALLLTTNYPPVTGGVSRYYQGLVGASEGELGVAGIDFGDPPPIGGNKLRSRLSQIRWAWRIARKAPSKIPLIAGHPHLAAGIALARRPFSMVVHGGEWQDYPFGGTLLRHFVSSADVILTSSSTTAAIWIPRSLQSKVVSITPGLPEFACQLLSQVEGQNSVPDSDRPFGIVTVARSSPRKGIQRLVDAVQICRRIGFDVAVKIVGQTQGNIRFDPEIGGINFLGQVADVTLGECYREAQAFVLVPERTSGGEGWEGFGIVYLEAAAAGLPIVATDTGGVTEAVTTDGALTLEVNCSPEDIASVLIDLSFEISVAKEMSLANRIWAESQKWDYLTGQVQALLSRVALQT